MPNLDSFLDSPIGSIVDAVKSRATEALRGNLIPITTTRTTHALSVHANIGGRLRAIGAVQALTMSQTRQVDEEYEMEVGARGLPIDLVPQLLSGRTLNIERYDLFATLMEQAFGTDELTMLSDQSAAFSLREVWTVPIGFVQGAIDFLESTGAISQLPTRLQALSSNKSIYEYQGCYFSSLGRTMRVNDSRIVGTNATIVWKKKVRVL